MCWQGPCSIPPKTVLARYLGGINIPSVSPFAGRPNVGASQNRAAHGSGPLSHPKKLPWPGIQGERDTFLYPDGRQTKIWCPVSLKKWPWSGIWLDRDTGSLPVGRPTKFCAPWHGAGPGGPSVASRKKHALPRVRAAQYSEGPRHSTSP